MDDQNSNLPAPTLPQVRNGVARAADLEGSLIVKVPIYDDMRAGDVLIAYLDPESLQSPPYTVVPTPSLGTSIELQISLQPRIGVGGHEAYYSVSRANEEIRYSAKAAFNVVL